MRFLRSLAALGLLTTLAVGCGGLTERDQALFDSGHASLSSGDWQAAEESFTVVIDSSVTHGPAFMARAQARFQMGQHEAAKRDIDNAILHGVGDDTQSALLTRARAQIELGRAILSDIDFRARSAHSDVVRRAREAFLAANSSLHDAASINPNDFDTNLWRAYALYRQENPRKALTFADRCLQMDPDNWRARYFRALILEGLHGANTQSFETAVTCIERTSSPALLRVHLYVVAVAPEMPEELRARIPEPVRRVNAELDKKHPLLTAFVEAHDKQVAIEKRRKAVDAVLVRAETLSDREDLYEALQLLNQTQAELGPGTKLTDSINDVADRWSKLLDLKSEAHLRIGDKSKLTKLLEEYRLARRCTTKLELKITLQQKINDLQLAIAHLNSSRRMREIGELLKTGAYAEVLTALGTIKVDSLDDEDDRDLYHYASGSSRYGLGEWESAALSFSKIRRRRSFEDLERIDGLALLKSGQVKEGVALLTKLTPQPGEDGANRAIALHFSKTDNLDKVLVFLAGIESKIKDDHELAFSTLKAIGEQKLGETRHRLAIESFEKAREILDAHLNRQDPDLYSRLGNTYFEIGDLKSAKRIYQDLIDSSATKANRKRFRDCIRRLGEIHLTQNAGALAYQQFKEFIDLGGTMPEALSKDYGRVAASFANFMPLDRVHYWNYTSTIQEYNYTLTVLKNEGNRYQVQRREDTQTKVETWVRNGIYLSKLTGEGGSVEFRIPINLSPVEKLLPAQSYETGPDKRLQYTTEVVAINQQVKLPSQTFDGCLKVRVTRSAKVASDETRRTRYVIWLAPDVGEVKREVFQDEEKVASTVLSSVVLKD